MPDLIGGRSRSSARRRSCARERRATFSRSGAIADAVPAAAREFSRAERLLVRVPAYGPGNTTPELTRAAAQPQGAADERRSRSGRPRRLTARKIELPLAGLAPGDYILEIKAGDVQELVGFRVTP